MANELTTSQKATIDDDTVHALPAGHFTVTSSDTAVATVEIIGGYHYCVAQSEGTATLNAVRLSDSATGSVEVTIVADPEAPEPGTFIIQLGAISPK